jgi:hypothetical protein
MGLQFIFLIAGLAAGFGLFLAILNRVLSYMRRKTLKTVLAGGILLLFLIFFSGVAWWGGIYGRWIILLTYIILLVGEFVHRWRARQLRGAPPVSQSGGAFSLRHPLTTTQLVVSQYHLSLNGSSTPAPNAGASLHGGDKRLRVAHLSDLHLNHHLPQGYYQQVMEQVRRAEADLILFTGDFITELEGIHQLPDLARRLHSRLGMYAIFGNHDHWAGAEQVAETLRQSGIEWIGNGWRRIPQDGWRDILLIGCEEPWSPDAFSPPPTQNGDLILALSHTADHVYRLSQLGATAVFSGHYHAGQFQAPGFGPLFIPSRYGRRFYHGHYRVGNTHLFVSAGIGAAEPPLRIYCPPDVFLVDFYED